ncbi:hypothetical protein [Pseudomonas matsuisoli]|uniref:Uncharacterized protein n=1 Tax=Pseudomonas matsuisoli TaxID=1515666 RepID=A0A917PUE0_9PSED|nr:hypothetical protein [Pseudomonas matsuisoli]GGJ92095.1 hypothetical protein GCM10009304_17360 [Pseudomonas matsuisoli]
MFLYHWIRENQFIFTLGISTATLCVWIFYAHLLLLSHRRQRRPKLIINRGAGRDLNSLCLISNMSAEPVFINQIFFLLHTSKGVYACDVTDVREGGDEDNPREIVLSQATHQGPLRQGDFTHIGSFAALIRRTAKKHALDVDEHLFPSDGLTFHSIEIRVIAYYSSEPDAIGVMRGYELTGCEGICGLHAEDHQTKQFTTPRQRRWIRKRWMISD